MSLYNTDNRFDWIDPIFMSTNQQLSLLVSDRHSPTIHLKKYRKVRFTQSKTPPVRSVSAPTSQCDDDAPENTRDKTIITQCGLPIDSAWASSCAQGMANHTANSDHSQTMSEQSSSLSSQSNSSNSQWSRPTSISSADYSMTDISGLVTPSLTFSDSDSSFRDLHCVESNSTSSLSSEVPTLATAQLRSLPNAYEIPHSRNRPDLWVKTTFQGTTSELYDSPIESDPNDGSPHSMVDGSIWGQYKFPAYDAPQICGGTKEAFPDSLKDCEVTNTCDIASMSPFKDDLSNQLQAPWCECHWLLNRPTLTSLEPREVDRACALHFRRMRNTRQTLLRRLQDMFEILWQKVGLVFPSLQNQVKQALIPVLEIPPTLQNGIVTLSSLSDTQNPPSLHGYISLAFFAKAWLSLGGQHGISGVTNSLFLETSRCVTAMASPAEQEAYDYLLQLLWQPVTAMISSPESYQLFCPTTTQPNVCATNYSSGTKAIYYVPPEGILHHLCRNIVDVLVNRNPSFGIKGPIELLLPAAGNSPANSAVITSQKIKRLIGAISNSKNGGLVTHCADCGQWFTGQDRVKNRKQHLTSSCPVTRRQTGYQGFKCPHCGDRFTRLDNVHQHVRRKHLSL